jgi:hypothetical protein
MIQRTSALARGVAVAAALTLGACSGTAPVSVDFDGRADRSRAIEGGTEFVIQLQSIGPGEYVSPPAISSDAVRFLDVSQAAAAVPAGATQRFRFFAQGRGLAVISFTHTGSNPVIADTITVF